MSEFMSDLVVNCAGQAVFKILEMTANGFFKKWKKAKPLQEFIGVPDTETYLCSRFVDGQSQMKRVLSAKDAGELRPNDILIRVNAGTLNVEIVYSGLSDKEGVLLDLSIFTAVKITNPRKFLAERGLSLAKTADTAEVRVLETLFANQCKQSVIDEILTMTYDALAKQDALPVGWWQRKLAQWLSFDWLELVEVKKVEYSSATADKAKEIAERKKIDALDLESQQQVHQRELQLQNDRHAYEAAIKDIEADRIINDTQRQAAVEKAKSDFDKATIEARAEIDIIKLEAEKRRAQLEAEIERLRNREDLATERLKQAEEIEKRSREMLGQYDAVKSEINSSVSFLKSAISEGIADAKRVSQYAGGLSSMAMEMLDRASGPAYLSQVLHEKSENSDSPVVMKKIELRSRDIGTKKVDCLRINSSLRFEFLAQRSGYATILNIGTSGRVWLQSPNAYVGIEKAKVAASQKYQIPGLLLPDSDLASNGLDYVEVGPPGWEVLVVIVSDVPLITEKGIFSSMPESPFVQFNKGRIDELLEQLSGLAPDQWDAGVLSFLVE